MRVLRCYGAMVVWCYGAWTMLNGPSTGLQPGCPTRGSGPEFADGRGSGGGWNRTLNRVLLQSGNIIEDMKDAMQCKMQCKAEVPAGKGRACGGLCSKWHRTVHFIMEFRGAMCVAAVVVDCGGR